MTLSEFEQRTLAAIETGCRTEDPDFVSRLNLDAAQDQRSRAVVMADARPGWVGWCWSSVPARPAAWCQSGPSSPVVGSPCSSRALSRGSATAAHRGPDRVAVGCDD